MRRAEFSKPVRREALRRSNGRCEAVGVVYGLKTSERCNAPLSRGVEFDHYPIRAADGGPGTIENCVAVCLVCHRHKTRTFDIPNAAKGKRVNDRHTGVVSPRHHSGGTGFLTNRSGPYKIKLNGEVVRR
jgi:hypothetical protein